MPPSVQQALLEVCRRHLSPHGMAYISFNVAAGWSRLQPLRAALIEEALSCKPLSEVAIDSAIRLVPREISPITDIRASKEYRLRMAQVMLARGIRTAGMLDCPGSAGQ